MHILSRVISIILILSHVLVLMGCTVIGYGFGREYDYEHAIYEPVDISTIIDRVHIGDNVHIILYSGDGYRGQVADIDSTRIYLNNVIHSFYDSDTSEYDYPLDSIQSISIMKPPTRGRTIGTIIGLMIDIPSLLLFRFLRNFKGTA